jgi:hypothetical protein
MLLYLLDTSERIGSLDRRNVDVNMAIPAVYEGY